MARPGWEPARGDSLTAHSRWPGPCSGTPRCTGSTGRSPPATRAQERAVTARLTPGRIYLSRAGRRAPYLRHHRPRFTSANRERGPLHRPPGFTSAGKGAHTTAAPLLTPALTRCSVSWFTSAFPRSRSGTKATDMAARATTDGNRPLSTFSPARARAGLNVPQKHRNNVKKTDFIERFILV